MSQIVPQIVSQKFRVCDIADGVEGGGEIRGDDYKTKSTSQTRFRHLYILHLSETKHFISLNIQCHNFTKFSCTFIHPRKNIFLDTAMQHDKI